MISYCTFRYFRRLITRDFTLTESLQKSLSSVSSTGVENTGDPVSWTESEPNPDRKLLKIAIIGAPNAGKSTVINQLVKRKVFPISKKVHTTRWRARAVSVEGDTQLVFLDTPGLVTTTELQKYKLQTEFVSGGEDAIVEADVIGVVHDLSNRYLRTHLNQQVLRLLHIYSNKESFLVLNKIDTLKSKRQLLDLSKQLTGGELNKYKQQEKSQLSELDLAEIVKSKPYWENFSDIFMVSALLGDGIDGLKSYLINSAQPGEWPFSETTFTDQNAVQVIEETVRSILLEHLPNEIPYGLEVQLEYLDYHKSGKIVAVVLVGCKSPRIERFIKGIKGSRIIDISNEAEQSLSETFLKEVKLTVVVTKASTKDVVGTQKIILP